MSEVSLKFRATTTEIIRAVERHAGIRNPVIEDSGDATGLVNALIYVAGHGGHIEATCTLSDQSVAVKIVPAFPNASSEVVPFGTDVQRLIFPQ